MKNIAKISKKTISLFICVLMIFNVALISCAAEDFNAKLYWSDDAQAWNDVETSGQIFDVSDFEPGSEVVKYLKIANEGTTYAFDYALKLVSEEAEGAGALANAIDVYVSEDVTEALTVSDMGESIGTLYDVIGGNAVCQGSKLMMGSEKVLAVALKMKDDADKSLMNLSVGEFSIELTATKVNPSEKFSVKFPQADFIYRVGNGNAVSLSSLFKAVDGAEINSAGVEVAVTNIDGISNASGTYTKNTSDWTKGTIKFTGTGSVEVTIKDTADSYSLPTSVILEVINATNATAAASAKTNNVVLLNDVGFGTIEVSNGYTLYGNGFTMKSAKDLAYDTIGVGFVTLNNGNLDNVKVIVPNFTHQILYKRNITENNNPAPPDSGDARYNVRSAVMMDSNSSIKNSYVSGGRAAIFARSGNLIIENSTICGGATANIHAVSAQNLTLRDTTLIQKPITSDANAPAGEKTVMGFSVMVECDSAGEGSPITIEGDFVQYAWVCEDYKIYVPSEGASLVNQVFEQTAYVHNIEYNGTAKKSVNLGFLYMPSEASAKKPTTMNDKRNNASVVVYSFGEIGYSIYKAYVYTYHKSLSGGVTDESFKTEPVYKSEKNGNIKADIVYSDTSDAVIMKTELTDNIWKSTLTVDLDILSSYTFSFSNLLAKKYGRNLEYTVKDLNGNIVDKTQSISLTTSGVYDYTLEITDNVYYGKDGQLVEGVSENYTLPFAINATKTSIEAPKLVDEDFKSKFFDNSLLLVKSKNSDWTVGVPAQLENITIRYWSTKANDYVNLNLGSITPTSTGKQNDTNNYWEYKGDDYSLKITCGVIHDTKQVYGMPVVVDNSGKKMYFTITSTNGYVSTGTSARTVTLTYEFKDNNGGVLDFYNTTNYYYANYSTQYLYSDFVKGTLKSTDESGGSSSGCLTEGTLITLADGSTKAVEDITFEDELLVWDFFNGEYTTAPATLIIDDGEEEYTVITLGFDDETELRLIDVHGLYDADLNEYVYITPENAESYIGHNFIRTSVDENGNAVTSDAKLENYSVSRENIGCHTILTAQHNNCIANGLLTVTPPPVTGWYDYFEIGEGMKYAEESVAENIEKYGLYTYDDFSDYITYEEFVAFNGEYLKILVGKGYFTFEDILEQIEAFGVGTVEAAVSEVSEEIAVMSISEEMKAVEAVNDVNIICMTVSEETAEIITIKSTGNNIKTANYEVSVLVEGAELTDGAYICNANIASFTVTATGAETGYVTVKVDGNEYLLNGADKFIFTVKHGNGKTVEVNYGWGTKPSIEAIESGKEFVFDLEEIFEITDASKTETGVTVTIKNTTDNAVTGDLYVATYDPVTNRLIDVAGATSVTVNAEKDLGKYEHELPYEIDTTDNCIIKVFLWENGTMSPIAYLDK